MIDKREKAYQGFTEFLASFIQDLNHRSKEGWSLLVEGPRDEKALRLLGYVGPLLTVPLLIRSGPAARRDLGMVIILTDLDREGASLAARFVKRLSHDGVKASMAERRRLKAASKGIFLHVENLARFAKSEE